MKRIAPREEVKKLIADLQTIANVWENKTAPGEENEVCERAIRVLTFLCHERPLSSDESLLDDLRSMKDESEHPSSAPVTRDRLGDLCQRAIDSIVLLNRESTVVTSSEVADLITQLGPECSNGGQCDPKVLDRAIDALVSLSREKVVLATVRDGIFEIDEMPSGIKVKVRDFNLEGIPEDRLCDLSRDGLPYVETVYAK